MCTRQWLCDRSMLPRHWPAYALSSSIHNFSFHWLFLCSVRALWIVCVCDNEIQPAHRPYTIYNTCRIVDRHFVVWRRPALDVRASNYSFVATYTRKRTLTDINSVHSIESRKTNIKWKPKRILMTILFFHWKAVSTYACALCCAAVSQTRNCDTSLPAPNEPF